METDVHARVGERVLRLSNLGKVLYPATGTTKAEVIDYYANIAPVLVPRLRDRLVTRVRFPDGVEGERFFEKHPPAGLPEWCRTIRVHGKDRPDYPLTDDAASLAWWANLAALEFHVPQWLLSDASRSGSELTMKPPPRVSSVVIDLDPGPGVDLMACAQAALLVRELLHADGLTAYAATSGGKGLHVYAPIKPTAAAAAVAYAKALGDRAAAVAPGVFVLHQAKTDRAGKILWDWLQNRPDRTTVAPYSLRGGPQPRVATPVSFDELAAATVAEDLLFNPADVLARVQQRGDLMAPPAAARRPRLPQPDDAVPTTD